MKFKVAMSEQGIGGRISKARGDKEQENLTDKVIANLARYYGPGQG